MSLIDPFATTGWGEFCGCPCLLLTPMGGRFGCSAIRPSTTFWIPQGGGFAETTACTPTESALSRLRSLMKNDGGGGFGIPDSLRVAEATTPGVGTSSNVTRIRGGGLKQPVGDDLAGMVTIGNSGNGASSSLSNR